MFEYTPPETISPESTRLALIAALNGHSEAVGAMTPEELGTLSVALKAIQGADARVNAQRASASALANEVKQPIEEVVTAGAAPLKEDVPINENLSTQAMIDKVVENLRGVLEDIADDADRAILDRVIQELSSIVPDIMSEVSKLRARASEQKVPMPSLDKILKGSETIRKLLEKTHTRLYNVDNPVVDSNLIRQPSPKAMQIVLRDGLQVDTSLLVSPKRGELPMYGFDEYPTVPNYRMEESGNARSSEHLATNVPGVAVEHMTYSFTGDGGNPPYRQPASWESVSVVIPYPKLLEVLRSALEEDSE